MDTTKTMAVPGMTRRVRMAADLLWFATLSFVAGLLAAASVAGVVVLLVAA
jgi:hypothetical protein